MKKRLFWILITLLLAGINNTLQAQVVVDSLDVDSVEIDDYDVDDEEVDIDAENLANAIGQITANAAQHTKSGAVRARDDYIGRRLIISVDDTGEGMPPEILAEVNRHDSYSTPNTKGLGLAITKELVSQMGGTVEISSELGSGTTVYIMIPCHASIIRRKRMMSEK